MKMFSKVKFAVVVLGVTALVQVANAALPETTYTNGCGQSSCDYAMYAVEGDNIALLIEKDLVDSNQYDEAVLYEMVARFSDAWAMYSQMAGRTPTWGRSYTTEAGVQLPFIAVIPQSSLECGGYACGYVGWTGIELGSEYFTNDFYTDLYLYGQLDAVLFYEMGRNFWFYDNNFSGRTVNDNEVGFATGFAVFMEHEIAKRINSPVREINTTLLAEQRAFFEEYLIDPAYNWEATFMGEDYPAVPTGRLDYYPNGWRIAGSADMVSSMLLYFEQEFGSEFYNDFFKFIDLHRGEQAELNDRMVSTLFKAASDAANRNLVSEFQQWKLALPADAISYQPGSGQPNIIQYVSYDNDWFFAEWDKVETSNSFDVVITATDINTGQALQYNRNTSGAEDYPGKYYLFFHKGDLCNAFGNSSNYTLTSVSIASAEDPDEDGLFVLNDTLQCVPPCDESTDSLTNHVAAGRVRTEDVETCLWGNLFCTTETTYYSIGPDENLGTTGSSVITLKEEPVGHFSEGSCPNAGDTTAPVITLSGAEIISLNVGDGYVELGATATDNVDGDLTSQIQIVGVVDTNAVGTYTITYSVSDAVGNNASTSRSVIVTSTSTLACVEDTFANQAAAGRVQVLYGVSYYSTEATPVYLGSTIVNASDEVSMQEVDPGVWKQTTGC